jgi:hypothetical protein
MMTNVRICWPYCTPKARPLKCSGQLGELCLAAQTVLWVERNPYSRNSNSLIRVRIPWPPAHVAYMRIQAQHTRPATQPWWPVSFPCMHVMSTYVFYVFSCAFACPVIHASTGIRVHKADLINVTKIHQTVASIIYIHYINPNPERATRPRLPERYLTGDSGGPSPAPSGSPLLPLLRAPLLLLSIVQRPAMALKTRPPTAAPLQFPLLLPPPLLFGCNSGGLRRRQRESGSSMARSRELCSECDGFMVSAALLGVDAPVASFFSDAGAGG